MKLLGMNLRKVKTGPLPEVWQRAIRALDRNGAAKQEEHARRSARSKQEAQRMWEEGNW